MHLVRIQGKRGSQHNVELTSRTGAPGWNSFVQPLIEQVNPSLQEASRDTKAVKKEQEEDIIDLSRDTVLVSSSSLELAINRLKVLVLSNPSPGLCRRVLKPVLLQLWTLTSWSNPSKDITVKYCTPARSLLRTYIRLFGKVENMTPIITNILCRGSADGSSVAWQFKQTGMTSIAIVMPLQPRPGAQVDLELTELESKAETFVNVISDTCSNDEISSLFLYLLHRWIQVLEAQYSINTRASPDEQPVATPIQNLVEVSILQRFMELSPEKLISQFDQLIDIICQVLEGDSRTPFGDDLISVVLSLLNLVITAPSFQRSDIKAAQLQLVEASLNRIGSTDRTDAADTAKNLGMLLKYRDDIDPTDQKQPSQAPSVRQIEDKRVYNLAMNYIMGDSDNPPPVVSEGLNMLSILILAESPVLDITAATVLMSSLLKNNEDYINLRVIKLFTQIADRHPKLTTRELLDNYLDAQEKLSTDIRLRFGEALVQVIERLGETFSGDFATQTGETLLSIAGRRGYRPKTMAKQAREERLEKLKSAKAGSSSPDEEETMDMDDSEEMTEAERANNDILAQIVQGWESKRGSEDIRMRTSALSIFGVGLEVNIAGLGATLVTNAVDLCVNVLTIEREVESGILRRAAIICILNFVRALDEAKESGRSLGFGLTDQSREDISRTLNYIAETDNDGLVQQHARDVVESLENWHVGNLIPQQNQGGTAAAGLARLAGLQVNPSISPGGGSGQPRPRIEEVE